MFEIKNGEKQFINKQEFVNKVLNLNQNLEFESNKMQHFLYNTKNNEQLFNSISNENGDEIELSNYDFVLEKEAFNEQQKTFNWA